MGHGDFEIFTDKESGWIEMISIDLRLEERISVVAYVPLNRFVNGQRT